MQGNLENYKAFYYVGKYGSFTEAANYMCLSQPAVSQSVKQLERELQVDLFVRTSRGVHLTIEGEMLYIQVEKAFANLEEGERKLRKMLDMDSGEIRIGASDMTLQFYLLPYLEEFHNRYPGIKVIVTNAPTPETVKYLEEGKIDFGIVSTPFVKEQHMVFREVRPLQDCFVAGQAFVKQAFPNLADNNLSYVQLQEQPIICLESRTSTRRFVDDYLDTIGVVLEPEFELATSDIIVQFARRNMGIGSVVRDFAQPYIDNGELIELKFQEEIPQRHIAIVRDEKVAISVAAQKLWDMLENEELV